MGLNNEPVIETSLEGVPLFFRGKVRDIYDLGDQLLIVATDRISAFDVVLPTPVPEKGKILTQIALFWFNYFGEVVSHHLLTSDVEQYPKPLKAYEEMIKGRSMLVSKAHRINIECVVRGYITGSAWKEYLKDGTVCGMKLPPGLKMCDRLPEPIFTPAIKAARGNHDINITEQQLINNEGLEVANYIKECSLSLYQKAHEYALSQGIIVADTKFEYGFIDGKIVLIDEILTPDSSRFWNRKEYQPGGMQKSFDKQFVRDYLDSLGWDRTPPAPALPPPVVAETRKRYLDIFARFRFPVS